MKINRGNFINKITVDKVKAGECFLLQTHDREEDEVYIKVHDGFSILGNDNIRALDVSNGTLTVLDASIKVTPVDAELTLFIYYNKKEVKKMSKKDVFQFPGRKGKVRGVDGYIVEALTGNSRETFLNVLDKKINEGKIKLYYLRHSENDWSKPITIENVVLFNRFGWFITTDLVNNPLVNSKGKLQDCIRLNRKTWEYTDSNDIDMISLLESL